MALVCVRPKMAMDALERDMAIPEAAGVMGILTLEDVFPLEKGKKLYYLFDYGDEWLFKITKSGKKPHNPEKGVKYPAVIEKLGENPEQYPMWEDE